MDKMSDSPSLQWFPGHMAKTRRLIRENIALVDCVAEIIDARVPMSSRNPILDEICSSKPRILILNKSDLADEAVTRRWVRYFGNSRLLSLPMDCKSGRGVQSFVPALKKALEEKIRRFSEKGMRGRSLRVMVAGIPNVGKSAFINRMAGSSRAKTEDRPGVTRGKQWIAIHAGVELLDTPGILWPKFEDQTVGERLAFTGAIKDEVFDTVRLAARLCEVLRARYPQRLKERYKLENLPERGTDLLEMIGRKRGMLIAGGQVNTERASVMLLDEFRAGRLGRITLEEPRTEDGAAVQKGL